MEGCIEADCSVVRPEFYPKILRNRFLNYFFVLYFWNHVMFLSIEHGEARCLAQLN